MSERISKNDNPNIITDDELKEALASLEKRYNDEMASRQAAEARAEEEAEAFAEAMASEESDTETERPAPVKIRRNIKLNKSVASKLSANKAPIDVDKVISSVDSNALMERSNVEWIKLLAKDCGVYHTKYGYIVKSFSDVCYRYIGADDNQAKDEAKANIVALLRQKYFTACNDKIEEKISEIAKVFCSNIRNNVWELKIGETAVSNRDFVLKRVPATCVAFRNGIFDFAKNSWLCKFRRIPSQLTNSELVDYSEYVVQWYFKYDFEPYDFSIMDTTFDEFCDKMRAEAPSDDNLTWQLFWNMSHDQDDYISKERMEHLAQIMGYTIYAPHAQAFVILVGQGSNGKNSLYDNAFTHWVEPVPKQADIDEIESDKFIGGTLMGVSHNISLETSPGTRRKSDVLKKLTGAEEFTAEDKGKRKVTTEMNVKFIFSTNNQDDLKFSDTSKGFQRRANLMELYYTWDGRGTYLRRGGKDFYNCRFDPAKFKNCPNNNKLFVYLGMYGIKMCTNNFQSTNFEFTHNDWSARYEDKNSSLEGYFNGMSIEAFCRAIRNYEKYSGYGCDDRTLSAGICIIDKKTKIITPLIKEPNFATQYEIHDWHDYAPRLGSKSVVTAIDDDENEYEYEEYLFEDMCNKYDMCICTDILRAMYLYRANLENDDMEHFDTEFKRVFRFRNYLRGVRDRKYVKIRIKGDTIAFRD